MDFFLFFLIGGVFCLFLLLYSLWLFFHFLSMLSGAPYIVSKSEHREKAKEILSGKEKVADIGSGDGTLLLALAEKNKEVHGYEINPFLVLLSRYRLRKVGLHKKAFVHLGSFWKKDFSSFDGIYIYGLPPIMEALGNKLEKELKPGTIVVSNAFPFPNWPSQSEEKNLFVYKIGSFR